MKQRFLNVRFSGPIGFIFLMSSLNVTSQTSEINIRFTSPTFDCATDVYCVDVEYSSKSTGDTLYGTNVRFFYNSTDLTFTEVKNFAPAYGIALTPVAQVGIPSSGQDLFNFETGEAATWVNGGIELQNTNAGELIGNDTWTKFYEICFTVVGSPPSLNNFCPELVWDLEQDRNNGGFFPGNDGLVITLKDGSGSTASDEVVEHLNWDYSGPGTAPYGDFLMTTGGCVTDDCCKAPNMPRPLKSSN